MESAFSRLEPFLGRGAVARCERCALQLEFCLCLELEPLTLATRVVVVSHHLEACKPTNTGRLVPLTLTRGEVRIAGRPGCALETRDLQDTAGRTLLLFPGPDSRELCLAQAEAGPLTLVVPDSNWRKARKLAMREAGLASLPHVHLPSGPPSAYRLRHHPDPRFLATFEAIARALGILEGPAVQAALERIFLRMVRGTLQSRGQSTYLQAGESWTRCAPEPLSSAQ